MPVVFGLGVDEPLVWYEGSGATERRYLIADNQGSIIVEGGASVTINKYRPYGDLRVGAVDAVQAPGLNGA